MLSKRRCFQKRNGKEVDNLEHTGGGKNNFFKTAKNDDLVISLKRRISVLPAKAGVQFEAFKRKGPPINDV